MKKLFLTFACLLGMSMTASALSTTTVLLQHNGNITQFEAEKINDAIEAAEDGDYIFLNEGTYPAFNLTKIVYVKGVGELTVIDGNVDISISDKPILTEPLLEYLKITGLVCTKKETTGLKIKQCWIGAVEFIGKTNDAYIDRCDLHGYSKYNGGKSYGLYTGNNFITTITVDGVSKQYKDYYVQQLTITNSYIGCVSSGSPNVNYINCEIKSFYMDRDQWMGGGTILNSIVSLTPSHAKLINCYLSLGSTDCEIINCYSGTNDIESKNKKTLESNGYYGNDGTIIGVFGGNTPYTLVPSVPKVTESSLKVDPQKKVLNVTLTVSPK